MIDLDSMNHKYIQIKFFWDQAQRKVYRPERGKT